MPSNELHFELESGLWWFTRAILPAWEEFLNRTGSYGSQAVPSPSAGELPIVFAPEGRGNQPLSEVEVSSVRWVIENQETVANALLDSLLLAYPDIQRQYGLETEKKVIVMPNVESKDDFRSLIGLCAVNVHQLQKDGFPYAGFEFGCTWDDENGLGVLMNGTKVVRIGGADTAILLWLAEEDGGTPLVDLSA